jgi:hypothetical protein
MWSKIIIAILVLIVLCQFVVIRSDKQIIRTMAQDHADRHEAQERIEGYEHIFGRGAFR